MNTLIALKIIIDGTKRAKIIQSINLKDVKNLVQLRNFLNAREKLLKDMENAY
jgi:hypothetical protein